MIENVNKINVQKYDYSLSLNDTFLIKGIAICLMIWHHLFIKLPEFGEVVFRSAQLGKICVALFLFISGYGLTIQYQKIQNNTFWDTLKFQLKRFVKFYGGYWLIFIIFVPISVWFFNRDLSIPYGGYHPIKRLFTDLIGINGWESYNTTWWFNQLILYFYLIFPLLFFFLKKWALPTLLFGLIALEINFPILMFEAHEWIFHFMIGIVFALNIKKINVFLNRFNKWLILIVLITLFISVAYSKVYSLLPYFEGTRLDSLLSAFTVIISVILFRNLKYVNKALVFFGKHSMNIYLLHTFIYGIFLHNFIYSFKYSALIFIILLLICVLISIGIEFVKKHLYINHLVNNVCLRIDKISI